MSLGITKKRIMLENYEVEIFVMSSKILYVPLKNGHVYFYSFGALIFGFFLGLDRFWRVSLGNTRGHGKI